VLYSSFLRKDRAFDCAAAAANCQVAAGLPGLTPTILSKVWVGDGAPLVGSQKACPGCLVSADGTRIYRPPQPKDLQFAVTDVQANFVQQTRTGTVVSIGHLNVKK